MAAANPRRRLIGLSTKMYFSAAQTHQVTHDLLSHLSKLPPASLSEVDIFVIPDFVTLTETIRQMRSASVGGGSPTTTTTTTTLWAGAQNCHWEDSGAYTGEVSPSVLSQVGVRIVEVGHAERRRLFGETDAVVAKKAAAVSRNGMVPLVCVGERTRDSGLEAAVAECRVQIESVMAAVPSSAEVALAYEPVWAIGAEKPAGEEHVLSVVEGIRGLECVRSREGLTRIVYGGSAGPGLYERLKTGLDGLFLGRFGHDPERFVRTIQEVAAA